MQKVITYSKFYQKYSFNNLLCTKNSSIILNFYKKLSIIDIIKKEVFNSNDMVYKEVFVILKKKIIVLDEFKMVQNN